MKNLIRTIALLLTIILSGCSTTRTTQSNEPAAKTEKKTDLGQQNILWERDGHQYTTFLVARFAGVETNDAYTLAYYSQYPDDDSRFAATSVSLNPWYFFRQWRSDINKLLHSLHGGNNAAVGKRRHHLESLIHNKIQQTDGEKFRDAGLMVHAFGDSFSHTKGKFLENERAYGSLYGHAADLHYPDKIANVDVFPRYAAYIHQLFSALATRETDGKEKLEKYLADLEAFRCPEGVECSPAALNKMTKRIIENAEKGGFEEERYKRYSPEPLTKAEVQKVMNEIRPR